MTANQSISSYVGGIRDFLHDMLSNRRQIDPFFAGCLEDEVFVEDVLQRLHEIFV